MVVPAGLLATSAPLHARFRLSEPAFRRALERPATLEPQRVGLHVVRSAGGGFFRLSDPGPGPHTGFVYATNGDPDISGGDHRDLRTWHLSGNWYAWAEGRW